MPRPAVPNVKSLLQQEEGTTTLIATLVKPLQHFFPLSKYAKLLLMWNIN
jgi:hypothetical protein